MVREGWGKPEKAGEIETDQVKVEKEIVRFCRKVSVGAGAFKEKFKMI